MFQLNLGQSLESGKRHLFPVSINSKSFSPDRVTALLSALSSRIDVNVTLLLADALQKYNQMTEEEAIKLGDHFIEKNKNFFSKGTIIIINTLEEWEKNKDQTNVKLVRWQLWKDIKKEEYENGSKLIDNECKQEGEGSLNKAMEKVAQSICDKRPANTKNMNYDEQQIKTSSMNYQKEENKYLFTFDCFDCHWYPQINESQQFVFDKYQKTHRLPVSFSYNFDTVLAPQQFSYVSPLKSTKPSNTLSVAGRLLIDAIEKYLASSEISPAEKDLFIRQFNGLGTLMDIQNQAAVSVSPYGLF